jgi:uncharacterized protein YfiM (DUF2279 family)
MILKKLASAIYLAICAAAILLVTGMSAHAKCTSKDRWTGQDKQQHLLMGSVIALAGTVGHKDPWMGFAYGAGAGLLKEAIDSRGSGTCSAQDLAVTLIGAAIGAGIGARIIVTPNSITYSMDF